MWQAWGVRTGWTETRHGKEGFLDYIFFFIALHTPISYYKIKFSPKLVAWPTRRCCADLDLAFPAGEV